MTQTPKIRHITGPEAFQKAFGVSRETLTKLEVYADLLRRWQKTINLIAPSTLVDLWHRHFADSAQVWQTVGATCSHSPGESVHRADFPLSPPGERARRAGGDLKGGEGANSRFSSQETTPSPRSALPLPKGRGEDLNAPLSPWAAEIRHLADFGSGAGFPGLVLAIMGAESGQSRHTLVESDSRKASFLREVARETRVAVDILCERIESPQTVAKVARVDVVTARALAPLPKMVPLLAPYFASHTIGFLSKGQLVKAEIEETARAWSFTSRLIPSKTDASGAIVVISQLARRV